MADGVVVIGGMESAVGIAEKGKFAGAAISGGCGGELVLRGGAEIVGSDNHHAKNVAVGLPGDQTGCEQPRSVRRRLCSGPEFGQRLWKARVDLTVGFDGNGNELQVCEGVVFVGADGGLVPFDLERRKI